MKKIMLVLAACLVFSSLAYSKDIFKIAKDGTPSEIESAVKAGADVNARDDTGSTLLMLAAQYNTNPEVILILLNSGVNPKVVSPEGKMASDYIQDNEDLKNTKAYQVLYDAQCK